MTSRDLSYHLDVQRNLQSLLRQKQLEQKQPLRDDIANSQQLHKMRRGSENTLLEDIIRCHDEKPYPKKEALNSDSTMRFRDNYTEGFNFPTDMNGIEMELKQRQKRDITKRNQQGMMGSNISSNQLLEHQKNDLLTSDVFTAALNPGKVNDEYHREKIRKMADRSMKEIQSNVELLLGQGRDFFGTDNYFKNADHRRLFGGPLLEGLFKEGEKGPNLKKTEIGEMLSPKFSQQLGQGIKFIIFFRDSKASFLNSVGKSHSRILQKHGGPTGRKEAELLSIWFQYMLQQLDMPNNPKIKISSEIQGNLPSSPSLSGGTPRTRSIQDAFGQERMRLERSRMIYGLAIYEIIRQVSVSCIQRGQLLEKLWRGWNKLNASTLSHFVQQKQLQYDQLRKRVLLQKQRYDSEIEHKAQELDKSNNLMIEMKANYVEKSKQVTNARKKIQSLQKVLQDLQNKYDEIKDQQSRVKRQYQAVKIERDQLLKRNKQRRAKKGNLKSSQFMNSKKNAMESSERGSNQQIPTLTSKQMSKFNFSDQNRKILQDDGQLMINGTDEDCFSDDRNIDNRESKYFVIKKLKVDKALNTSDQLLKKALEERQESLASQLPIQVTVCNAQCQTDKLHKHHKLIQCLLLDPDVVEKMRQQQERRIEYERMKFSVHQKQQRIPLLKLFEQNDTKSSKQKSMEQIAYDQSSQGRDKFANQFNDPQNQIKRMIKHSYRQMSNSMNNSSIKEDQENAGGLKKRDDDEEDDQYEEDEDEYDDEDYDDQDENSQQSKSMKSKMDKSKSTNYKKQKLTRQQLREQREKARLNRHAQMKLEKQFQKAKRLDIRGQYQKRSGRKYGEDLDASYDPSKKRKKSRTNQQKKNYLNVSSTKSMKRRDPKKLLQIRANSFQRLSLNKSANQSETSEDDSMDYGKSRPQTLQQAVARDDMFIFLTQSTQQENEYSQQITSVLSQNLSPFQQKSRFLGQNLSSFSGTKTIGTGNQPGYLKKYSIPLHPLTESSRELKSIGLSFKISLHPVHQYLHRQFGVIDGRDLSKIKLSKLKSNPISIKLLTKTITKIYLEFMQIYKASLSKSSEMFIMKLSLAEQLYDSIHHKYGLQNVTERNFQSILGGVIKYKQFYRIQVFGRFLGVYDDYRLEDFKFYLLGLHFLLNTGDLGISIQNPDHQRVHYAPLHKAEQFTFNYFKGKLDNRDFSKLFKSVRSLKIENMQTASSLDLIDIDSFLTLLISVRKQVIFPDRASICDIFKAADLEQNGCLTKPQFLLLCRNLQPDAINKKMALEIFDHSKRVAKQRIMQQGQTGHIIEQDIDVITFDIFIPLCLHNQIFMESSQHKLIGVTEEISLQQAINNIKQSFETRALNLIQRLQNAHYDTWGLRRYLLMIKRNLNHQRIGYQAILCFKLLQQESFHKFIESESQFMLGSLNAFTQLQMLSYTQRKLQLTQSQASDRGEKVPSIKSFKSSRTSIMPLKRDISQQLSYRRSVSRFESYREEDQKLYEDFRDDEDDDKEEEEEKKQKDPKQDGQSEDTILQYNERRFKTDGNIENKKGRGQNRYYIIQKRSRECKREG